MPGSRTTRLRIMSLLWGRGGVSASFSFSASSSPLLVVRAVLSICGRELCDGVAGYSMKSSRVASHACVKGSILTRRSTRAELYERHAVDLSPKALEVAVGVFKRSIQVRLFSSPRRRCPFPDNNSLYHHVRTATAFHNLARRSQRHSRPFSPIHSRPFTLAPSLSPFHSTPSTLTPPHSFPASSLSPSYARNNTPHLIVRNKLHEAKRHNTRPGITNDVLQRIARNRVLGYGIAWTISSNISLMRVTVRVGMGSAQG